MRVDDLAGNICHALLDGVVGPRAAESILSGGSNLLNPRAYAQSLAWSTNQMPATSCTV